MKLVKKCLIVFLATLPWALGEPETATVFMQSIDGTPSSATPVELATITYDLGAGSEPEGSTTSVAAEVSSFETPELPEDARLVRVGLFNPKTGHWASSTSVASVDNFSKGYAPHFTLHLGQDGERLGLSCRGVRIDAGATRDFGPQAVVNVAKVGSQPALNKPVVLTPEGKQMAPPEEKTLLQRYWWVAGIVLFLVVSGGGGGAEK